MCQTWIESWGRRDRPRVPRSVAICFVYDQSHLHSRACAAALYSQGLRIGHSRTNTRPCEESHTKSCSPGCCGGDAYSAMIAETQNAANSIHEAVARPEDCDSSRRPRNSTAEGRANCDTSSTTTTNYSSRGRVTMIKRVLQRRSLNLLLWWSGGTEVEDERVCLLAANIELWMLLIGLTQKIRGETSRFSRTGQLEGSDWSSRVVHKAHWPSMEEKGTS